MENAFYIFLLSILGFINAFYLYYQHKKEIATGKKMFCIIGGDCGAVVGSKYGRTLGAKNEKIGMTYYAVIALYVLTTLFLPETALNLWGFAKSLAAIAVLFSVYLIYAQTILLRKLCSWCLIAITINFILFYLV